uniref:Uncharacterized protein N19B2.115 n=1 Tax=Trypanosoma brucei TaxID=5691 RepID=Q8WPQ0_9TRYP|nr:hypothetical protein [Trypanosoma brucei]
METGVNTAWDLIYQLTESRDECFIFFLRQDCVTSCQDIVLADAAFCCGKRLVLLAIVVRIVASRFWTTRVKLFYFSFFFLKEKLRHLLLRMCGYIPCLSCVI